MTNEEAIKELRDASDSEVRYGDTEYHYDKVMKRVEAFDMAIKALEQQPNRCDSCVHLEEQDGSNCYECVKGMADNFETQPTDADCISREALDNAISSLTYWHFENDRLIVGGGGNKSETVYKVEDVWRLTHCLPSVTPSYNSIKAELEPSENYISKQDVDALVDELARKISDKRCGISRGRSIATIMQDILDLPPVTPTRPKGKWIDDSKEASFHANCSHCDYQIDTHYERGYLNYCPNCGAKMEVEE